MATQAQFKIGLAYIKLGMYEKAVSELENILRLRDDAMFPQALVQMSECYRLMGDKYRSEKTLIHIRDKYPGTSALINILSDYNNRMLADLNTGDTAVLRSVKETLDFFSRDFMAYGRFYLPAYLRFGELYMEKGMYAEAQAIFETIDRVFFRDVEDEFIAAVRLADLLAYNGKFEKAAFKYSQVTLKNRPNSRSCAEAWMGLGLLNRAQGKTDDAIKCYNYVVNEFGALRDMASEAQLNCAFTYLEKEIPDLMAMDLFKKVVMKYRDRDQHVAVARFMLGEISETDMVRRFDKPVLDYYIAQKHRNNRDYSSALFFYSKYRKSVERNLLLTRLVDQQIAYVK
jgi:tetratricopeptide (TPR) repeat protein